MLIFFYNDTDFPALGVDIYLFEAKTTFNEDLYVQINKLAQTTKNMLAKTYEPWHVAEEYYTSSIYIYIYIYIYI